MAHDINHIENGPPLWTGNISSAFWEYWTANFKAMYTLLLTGDHPTLFETDIYSEGIWVRKRCGNNCLLVVTGRCFLLGDECRPFFPCLLLVLSILVWLQYILVTVSSRSSEEGEEGLFSSNYSMKCTAWTTLSKYMVKGSIRKLVPLLTTGSIILFALLGLKKEKYIFNSILFTGSLMLKLS